MAELQAVAETLARQLGLDARVRLLERRAGFDLLQAATPRGGLVIKMGRPTALVREACNLERAGTLVGHLAPELVGVWDGPDRRVLLVTVQAPGAPVEPWRLSLSAWRKLTGGLLRLHGQVTRRTFRPSDADFLILGPSFDRTVSLHEFAQLLAAIPEIPERSTAIRLVAALQSAVALDPAIFEVPARLTHGDLWPENLLVRGNCCWLVDWAWLRPADYAFDLANLKLLLDWVWPAGVGQLALERLLERYSARLRDPTLRHRLAVYLPLVSLVHLLQYAEGGVDDPYNVAASRACIAAAVRDLALWRLPRARERVLYAIRQPYTSEYAAQPATRKAR